MDILDGMPFLKVHKRPELRVDMFDVQMEEKNGTV